MEGERRDGRLPPAHLQAWYGLGRSVSSLGRAGVPSRKERCPPASMSRIPLTLGRHGDLPLRPDSHLIHPVSHLSHDPLGRLASERAPTAKLEMAEAAASATQAATYVFSRRLAPWFSGAPLVASGRDGRRTQAILDAMYRSAYDEDGGWVTVAPEL